MSCSSSRIPLWLAPASPGSCYRRILPSWNASRLGSVHAIVQSYANPRAHVSVTNVSVLDSYSDSLVAETTWTTCSTLVTQFPLFCTKMTRGNVSQFSEKIKSVLFFVRSIVFTKEPLACRSRCRQAGPLSLQSIDKVGAPWPDISLLGAARRAVVA